MRGRSRVFAAWGGGPQGPGALVRCQSQKWQCALRVRECWEPAWAVLVPVSSAYWRISVHMSPIPLTQSSVKHLFPLVAQRPALGRVLFWTSRTRFLSPGPFDIWAGSFCVLGSFSTGRGTSLASTHWVPAAPPPPPPKCDIPKYVQTLPNVPCVAKWSLPLCTNTSALRGGKN